MQPLIRVSRNVLADLSRVVAERLPALSTEHGELFPSDTVPLAAVRLKVSTDDYLTYLTSLPREERPNLSKIVPVDGLPFNIVVIGFVSVADGRTAINGKPAKIL